MSLLHKPIYTDNYTLEDDTEGLKHLKWSQFMCKCGRCSVKSGKMYMERLPVQILDDVAREEQMRFDVQLGYVCEKYANDLSLPTKDSHRVGLAVNIRILSPKKRIKLLRSLIVRGVTRYKVSRDSFYFDVDDLKEMSFVVF